MADQPRSHSLFEHALTLKWQDLLRAAVAEFLGCFFVNLFACGAALATNNYGHTPLKEPPANLVGNFTYGQDYQATVSIAFGVAYGINVALFQHISGGHVNPSITLGMMCTNNIGVVQGLVYVPCQFAGSIAGSAVLKALTPPLAKYVDLFSTHPYKKHGMTVWHGVIWELIMTFQMMLVYLEAREETLTSTMSGAPLIIGVSVMINHLAGLYTIGGCMNPAQSLGSAVVTLDFEDLWVYIVFSPIGAVVGAFLHYSSFKPEPEEVENVELPQWRTSFKKQADAT